MDDENNWKAINEIVKDAVTVPYIKVIKNTKGYNWEIKMLSLDIDELTKLNNEMINRFGGDI